VGERMPGQSEGARTSPLWRDSSPLRKRCEDCHRAFGEATEELGQAALFSERLARDEADEILVAAEKSTSAFTRRT
jgi:hypothetical protein